MGPQKFSPALSRMSWRPVREDPVQSLTQMRARTDDDFSPETIRWHLQKKALKNRKEVFRGHIIHTTNSVDLTRKKINLDGTDGFQCTGMTRISHGKCLLRGTMEEAPSWSRVLFPSVELWCWRCAPFCSRICWDVVAGIWLHLAMLPIPAWQRTSSRRITLLFCTILHVPLI